MKIHRLKQSRISLFVKISSCLSFILLLTASGCGGDDLQDAVMRDDVSSVASLLVSGDNPNRRLTGNSISLHFVRSRDVAIELINAGADTNARTDQGNTPLHVAAAFGNYEVAQVLMSHGADINAKNINGYSPLHWAVSELIDESGVTEPFYRKQPDLMIDFEGKLAIAKYLLDNGANPNIIAANGETPLHKAATSWDDSRYVDLLIKYGADINAIGPNGWTPLQYAEARGQQDAIKSLEKELNER